MSTPRFASLSSGLTLTHLDKEEEEEEEENTNMNAEPTENPVKRWKPLEEPQVPTTEVNREATAVDAFDAAFRLLAELPPEYQNRFFRKIASGQRSNDPDLKYALGSFLKKRVSAMGLPESVTEGILDKFFITAEPPETK